MNQKAAIRRRKQFAKGNRHVAKLGRRVYRKPSAGKLAARLRRVIEGEKRRQRNKQLKASAGK
jgi:hypothetical protein